MRKRGKEVSLNFKVFFSPFSFNLLVNFQPAKGNDLVIKTRSSVSKDEFS